MAIYQPYFYVIQDNRNGMYYAGAKWAKDANPSNFMKPGGYETSSSTVKILIEQYGHDNFVIRKLRVFATAEKAQSYETRFLCIIDAKNNPKFYNGHNNDYLHSTNSKAFKDYLKSHGVENTFQIPEVKEKIRRSNIKNFGVPYPMMSTAIQEKAKHTKKQRYNDENFVNVEKMKRTKEEKYGDSGYVNIEQRIITNQQKYGGKAPACSENVLDKMKSTCLEKYGETSYAKTEEAKIQNLILKRNKANRPQVQIIKDYVAGFGVRLNKGWYQSSDDKLDQIIADLALKFGSGDNKSCLA